LWGYDSREGLKKPLKRGVKTEDTTNMNKQGGIEVSMMQCSRAVNAKIN